MARLRYHPLRAASEVRVLHVLPGRSEDAICGHLIAVDLDTHPRYRCVSYTWGEPIFTSRIIVNGDEFPVTKNLESALRTIRYHDENIEIWIDAICIDQANIKERNHQVSLMRRIYSECEECIIYLGEEHDNSQIIPDFLQLLVKGYQGLLFDEDFRPGDTVHVVGHDGHTSIPRRGHPGWHAFGKFMERPWFSRVWIIQEYALPRLVTMICGNWSMDATNLATILSFQRAVGIAHMNDSSKPQNNRPSEKEEDQVLKGIELAHTHQHIRMRCGNWSGELWSTISEMINDGRLTGPCETTIPLIYLLNLFRLTECSDPRDKFYGVFGLATDLKELGLSVDYSRSVLDIGLDIGKRLIRQGYGRELLESVGCSVSRLGGWPSWLPDWIHSEEYHFSRGKRRKIDIFHHNNHGVSPIVHLKDESNTLTVRGYVLDAIGELGLDRSSLPLDAPPQVEVQAVLDDMEMMVANSRYLRPEQNRPDSQWRTIIGNELLKPDSAAFSTQVRNEASLNSDSSPPPEYGIKFLSFRLWALSDIPLEVRRHLDKRHRTRSELRMLTDKYSRLSDERQWLSDELRSPNLGFRTWFWLWWRILRTNEWMRHIRRLYKLIWHPSFAAREIGPVEKDHYDFELCWLRTNFGRFCITKSGMMALVPKFAKVGDRLFAILGDPEYRTYVVRKQRDSDCFTWIGPAYVHCVLGDEYSDIEGGEPCEISVC